MIKLLVVAYLCVSFTMVSSQSCSNTTSARRQFGFDNSVTTPISGSGFAYCQSLKAGTSCCTAATVATFQDKTKTLLQNLTASVIKRDQYFVAANTNTVGKLQAATDKFATTVTTYQNLPSGTNANPSLTQPLILALLQAMLASSQAMIAVYALAAPSVTLGTFQSERTSCVIEMVKLQSAVWCLACDPNAASKGYNPSTETLPLSPYTCNKLKSNCYKFVTDSFLQSLPISALELIGTMDAFTTLVNRIRDGNAVALDAFDYTSPNPPSGDVPDACNSQDNCNFICTDIINNGVLNQDYLVAGSVINNSSRLLEQNEQRVLTDRELQSGTYRPADDESGVSVTFSDDPGNANKASSGVLSFGSVLIGAIMLLSSYLL